MKLHELSWLTRRKALFLTAAAVCIAGSVSAASIGLKLGVNGNGGLQSTDPSALAPTDIAGASGFQQAYWNILGRWGDNTTNTYGTNSFPLLDSDGADTFVTINWDATGRYAQTGGTTTPQGTPDGDLMNSYDDSNSNPNVPLVNGADITSGQATVYAQSGDNKPLVYLSGLQTWLATQSANYYDVVVYSDGDATSGRIGEYWLIEASSGETTGPLTNLTFGADLTTHVFICDRANFITTTTYAEVSLDSLSGYGAVLGNNPGNYAVLPGLSADSFLLRTEQWQQPGGTRRSPINAIQIIARTTAETAWIAPLEARAVYAGGTAKFVGLVGGVTPLTYAWQKDGTPMTDGGNISGSTTPTLTITGVTSADAADYSLVASNPNGSVTSSVAPLTLVSYAANSFPEKIATNSPVAYWRLNDMGAPYSNYALAQDYIGGFDGLYGNAAQNGAYAIAGPQPPDFPGFETGNLALQSVNGTARSWVVAPPLNLNTNTVTMCAWIYPTAYNQADYTGLIFSRNYGTSDVNGLGYRLNNNLGYTWNNQGTTYGFVSGLVVPTNQWSFVALVVTPENATLYCYNQSFQLSAVNNVTNAVASFAGPTCIGADPSSVNTPQGRAFTGSIDEVAVFNHALPQGEIYNLYKKGLGLNYLNASVSTQPRPVALYPGRTAHFSVVGSGDPVLSYQWRKDASNLSDGGKISGATTPDLTITEVADADTGSYDCVVKNLASATSQAATLTIVPLPDPMTAYETALQAANPDWYWRFNEPLGSVYAYDYWGGIIATNENVVTSADGPRPPDFPGFEALNLANSYDGFTSDTSSGLSLLNNAAEFSILGWIKSPSTGYQAERTGLFGQNDVAEFGFHGADASGNAQLGIWTAGGGAAFLPQALITPDQWCLIAAVGDGSSLSLYLFTTNGAGGAQVYQSVTSAVTTNYGSSGYSFKIGGGGILDATGNWFYGGIDEVAVFTHALLPGELADLFATSLGTAGLPPQIVNQPVGTTLYEGRTINLNVTAVGSAPLTYQWRTNGVAVPDGGSVSGATTASLTIENVAPLNAGDYDVVVANSAGSVTSTVATVSVVSPGTAGYEITVIGLNPLAYYRLNETTGTDAYEYFGGHTGTYGAGATMGVAGPQDPMFFGFENTNTAVQVVTNLPGSWVAAPFGSLSTNTVTFTMWVYPVGAFDSYAGLLVNRNSGVAGGFGYTGGQIGYTWNNNNAATYNFRSELIPPLDEWSFVAAVISPTNAIIYMANASGFFSATNVLNHTSDVFGNNWQIGSDNNDNADSGARTFNGRVDEVAVFNYCLTPDQIALLYNTGASGPQVTLTITPSGTDLILTWPQGTLEQAPDATGPWSPVPGNPVSGYTVTPTENQMFFRVQVR